MRHTDSGVQERTVQELASGLVERDVLHNVSILVSGVLRIADEVSSKTLRDAFGINHEELMDLCQRADWREPVRQFIMDGADNDQLKEVADNNGSWSEVLDKCLPEISDGGGCFRLCDSTELFSDEGEAREAAIESVLPEIRKQVLALVNTDEAFERVGQDNGLDPDYVEVYEHWAVSPGLAQRLKERGEVVGGLADFELWGRCCTGQSISMDSVIRGIAGEQI